MRDVPDCLKRRYNALDELIQQLESVDVASHNVRDYRQGSDDPGIKLMCEFWSILKADPDCDLAEAVEKRMVTRASNSSMFGPKQFSCYMACGGNTNPKPSGSNDDTTGSEKNEGGTKRTCCDLNKQACKCGAPKCGTPSGCCSKNSKPEEKEGSCGSTQCGAPKCGTPSGCCNRDKGRGSCESSRCGLAPKFPGSPKSSETPKSSASPKSCSSPKPSGTPKSTISKTSMPISKALYSLKEAASFDKKCSDRITTLMQTQNQLKEQIQRLEQREQDGMKRLKQADCMWECMEQCFKKKLEASQKTQNDLMRQLSEVEKNNNKWRKNKKDLESQMISLNKAHKEITEKLAQKANDINCINKEIAEFQKRIENNKKETENTKVNVVNRRMASDKKITAYAAEISKLKEQLNDEYKTKMKKEDEGTQYVKEARDDLQKICRVLLQKKLENEDLKAEKDALIEEIELLNQTMDQCKERCGNKQNKIREDIKIVDKEIKDYQFQCIQCHQCIDTSDVRKMCSDCPRCMEERECITIAEDGNCEADPTMDCVCMVVKHKFMENVFDNMYTVLARQASTKPGKAVAEAIVSCLRKSRNGKLNSETRKILQDFVLNTIRKNLNLTIVGGAVKTRCELDSDIYNQLMLCLKQVKPTKAPKEDKAIGAKKESCRRWGGTSECNCPKGPKDCICTRKAPPPVGDKAPSPKQDPADAGEKVQCPHKQSTACGPDCGMRTPSHTGTPNAVGSEISWKREPCKPPCSFSTNMRAAQCVLGPESLTPPKNFFKTHAPVLPPHAFADMVKAYKLKQKQVKPIVCELDRRSHPRERIIEEVMGKFTEGSSLDKVTSPDKSSKVKGIGKTKRRICLNSKSKNILPDKSDKTSKCLSEWILIEGTEALKEMLIKKKVTHVCKTGNDYCPIIEPEIDEYSESEVPKGSKKECDKTLTVILQPRFKPAQTQNKIIDNRRISKNMASGSIKDQKCDLKDTRKNLCKIRICDVAKQLINDVTVPDANNEENINPHIEWITVDSLLKQITFGVDSNINISNITNDEMELKSEIFGIPNSGNRSINTEKSNAMHIKASNNTTPSKKLKTRST